MTESKLRTRCYYTDYVNHMVRFYITCPDSVQVQGKRRADIENWVAVQGALRVLIPEDRERVLAVYKTHYNLPKAVDMYCSETGADPDSIWKLITKVSSIIARRRGLT